MQWVANGIVYVASTVDAILQAAQGFSNGQSFYLEFELANDADECKTIYNYVDSSNYYYSTISRVNRFGGHAVHIVYHDVDGG